MLKALFHLPLLITLMLCIALLAHGPIPQLENYHQFADQSVVFGIPHAADVLSNAGFAIIGLWGMIRLWPRRRDASLASGWHGYNLFLIGLTLTALGSAFYHLAPDNLRLVWDRLPIALACAGLLAAVRAESLVEPDSKTAAGCLSLAAVMSVAWWYATEQIGMGDLRPYLLLQGLPLILIPVWQAIYQAPRADRLAFGAALMLYICAKLAEINDHALFSTLGFISGHTLKHLLATLAAGVIVVRLAKRSAIKTS